MSKKRIRLKGRLRIYMQTSLYLGLLLLLVDVGTYFLDVRAGFLLSCFLLFYFGMIVLLMFYNRPVILNEMISFATQYGQVQKTLLRDMVIPYALLDENGRVIWCNTAFKTAIHSEKGFRKSITYVFPSITKEKLPQGDQEVKIPISFEESEYMAYITRVSLKGVAEDSDILEDSEYDGCLYAIYLYDETALKIALRENDAQSLAVGVGYLRIEGACYVGIGVLFLLYGYFRAVAQPRISLLLTVISLGTRVLLAYSCAPWFGVEAIWWAIPIGWVLADLVGGTLVKRVGFRALQPNM